MNSGILRPMPAFPHTAVLAAEFSRLQQRLNPNAQGTRQADVAMVGGYDAPELLNRANQLGPFYNHFHFRDARAGMIVAGLTNGTRCRIYPADDDQANPQPSVEVVTTEYAQDVFVPRYLVNMSPWTGQQFAWVVYDEDPDNPALGVQRIDASSLSTDTDIWFEQHHTFINRGRKLDGGGAEIGYDYRAIVDDRDGGDTILPSFERMWA